MSFLEFVAIQLSRESDRTVAYKSISSFLSSIKGCEDMALEELLRLWVADMLDRGMAVASRKRYFEKLSALHKAYCAANGRHSTAFDSVRELCASDVPPHAEALQSSLMRIEKIFDALMTDAASKPELALLLYLLFNASADIESAISLTAVDYRPQFRQLDDIVKPRAFHHRRKYVFDLSQSRKRQPQLVREVIQAIDSYLRSKDVRLQQVFTPGTITALWMAKARACGVRLAEMKAVVGEIPDEYDYVRHVTAPRLSAEEISAIKQRVAEALAPSAKRWYAIKLRRGVTYDALESFIKNNCKEYYDDDLLFYPQKEISRRIDKKIVTETVPVIPDIVFSYINPRHIGKLDALIKSERLGYVFRSTPEAGSDYSVIDSRSMSGFQYMIGVFTPDIKIELTTEAPAGIGRDVLITGGVMAGYEGTIYDIKDDSHTRQIYIRLSEKYAIMADVDVKVEEVYVKPL